MIKKLIIKLLPIYFGVWCLLFTYGFFRMHVDVKFLDRIPRILPWSVPLALPLAAFIQAAFWWLRKPAQSRREQLLQEIGIGMVFWGLFIAAWIWATAAKEFTYAMF